jgi:hypothetical protein
MAIVKSLQCDCCGVMMPCDAENPYCPKGWMRIQTKRDYAVGGRGSSWRAVAYVCESCCENILAGINAGLFKDTLH